MAMIDDHVDRSMVELERLVHGTSSSSAPRDTSCASGQGHDLIGGHVDIATTPQPVDEAPAAGRMAADSSQHDGVVVALELDLGACHDAQRIPELFRDGDLTLVGDSN